MQDVGAELRRAFVERRRELRQRYVGRDVLELLRRQKRQQLGQRVRVDAVEQPATIAVVERGQRVGLIGGVQIVQHRRSGGELTGVDPCDDVPDGGRRLSVDTGVAGGTRVSAGGGVGHRESVTLGSRARSSADRALGFGPRGRGFDSLRACHQRISPKGRSALESRSEMDVRYHFCNRRVPHRVVERALELLDQKVGLDAAILEADKELAVEKVERRKGLQEMYPDNPDLVDRIMNGDRLVSDELRREKVAVGLLEVITRVTEYWPEDQDLIDELMDRVRAEQQRD